MSLSEFHPEALPKHVAIIMDGNGRWGDRAGQSPELRAPQGR